SPQDVDAIGEGHVWTGTQGKGNGLVDEIGGLEKAIEVAKQLANLPADKDVKRVVLPEPRPLLESLFGADNSSDSDDEKVQEAVIKAMPEDARRLFRYARLFDQMKRGEATLIMPFELNIK